jgi:hypothetical protein
MSGINVFLEVSEHLRQVLWHSISTDKNTSDLMSSEMDIVFTNPTETARRRSSSNKLSLWLYQVTENEFLKNQPPARGNGHNSLQETPLVLNLYYLVTPFGPTDGTTDGELRLLGKLMQVFYDSATLYVQSPSDNIFEELRLILCRLSLEELTRIWEALREPYRLSVCYQVRVAHIDSSRIPEGARVVESNSDYGSVPPEPDR